MSCSNCPPSTPLNFDVQMFFSNQCFSQGSTSCRTVSSAACVAYLGPNLSCSGVNTNDSLETALQKIDTQICSAIGDYSTYQFNCLVAWLGSAITTEAEFVDAITGYACEIRTDLDTFINTTFANYETSANSRFNATENPTITCSAAGVGNTDNIGTVLTKYCSTFSDIYSKLDISGVTWNGCYTVVTPPTTLTEGFQLLADQICSTKALIGSSILPVFNNIGSCLPSPGASDTLVATVEKIKTRLCQSPTLDNANLTSSCTTIPGTATDLEGLLQNILDKIDSLWQIKPTYSGDFTTTPNSESPCDGITVSLATPLNIDRFVAVSVGDASPGTLIDKLESTGGSVNIVNDSDSKIDLNIKDGDYGDILVEENGTVWNIDNEAVTFGKFQNINTQRLLGRQTAGVGSVEELQIGSGLALSGGVLNTVGRSLIDVQVFRTSGTWTKPTGCNAAIIEILGAGGGGGAATANNSESAAAGGGGSGAYLKLYITSGLGATEAVSVGVGGAGSSDDSVLGSSGGSSSFGTHGTAQGGTGGAGMASGTSILPACGGGGGGFTYADSSKVVISTDGNCAHGALRVSATDYLPSGGASSIYGGAAGCCEAGEGADANSNSGAGGGGATNENNGGSTNRGGDGGSGLVIVYSYT